MTILGNTLTHYGSIGNREDLSNVIYNISPEETPFMSNAGRDDMDAVFTEWQTDALAAPNGANAQLEGDNLASYDAVVPTTRLGNTAQISRKSVSISGTQERIKKAGRKSELSYQVSKKGAELKRDLETIHIGTNQGATIGSATVARTEASFLAWLRTNVTNVVAGGANPAAPSGGQPLAGRTDGTTPVAFTEAMLKTLAQSVWNSGGAPKTLMVDGTQKQTVSGFAGIATKTLYQEKAKVTAIIGAADVYVSDFGTYAIVPNRFQRHRDAWLVDFDYVKVAYLRPFKLEELAKTGDADNRLMLVEYTLKVTNEAAHGLVADLA